MEALYEGDRERAESLRGPNLNVFEAASLGDVDRLRALLDDNPALVASWSPDGFTPLHYAAYFGTAEAVRLLAERGAELEAPAQNREFAVNARPLHSAVVAQRWETVAALLEAGADPSAERPGGLTALAEAQQLENAELADLLRSYGARV